MGYQGIAYDAVNVYHVSFMMFEQKLLSLRLILNFVLSCGKSSVLFLSPYGNMGSFYDHYAAGYLSVVSQMALEATSNIK